MKYGRADQLRLIDEMAEHADKIRDMVIEKLDDAMKFPVDVEEIRRVINVFRKHKYITSANFERMDNETQDKGERRSLLHRMWKAIA